MFGWDAFTRAFHPAQTLVTFAADNTYSTQWERPTIRWMFVTGDGSMPKAVTGMIATSHDNGA